MRVCVGGGPRELPPRAGDSLASSFVNESQRPSRPAVLATENCSRMNAPRQCCGRCTEAGSGAMHASRATNCRRPGETGERRRAERRAMRRLRRWQRHGIARPFDTKNRVRSRDGFCSSFRSAAARAPSRAPIQPLRLTVQRLARERVRACVRLAGCRSRQPLRLEDKNTLHGLIVVVVVVVGCGI